ncbi:MAG: Sec-independent protein translocase subunit TatA/TatB [Thermoleophilia bacterium]
MFEGLLAPQHLILVLVAALLIFGPKRLPEIGRGLGKGLREFKSSMTEAVGEIDESKQKQDEVKKDEVKSETPKT